MRAAILQHKINRMIASIDRMKRDTRLPICFLDPDIFDRNNPATWRPFPGCEAQNQEMELLARRRGIAVQYLVMGPNEDGIEP